MRSAAILLLQSLCDRSHPALPCTALPPSALPPPCCLLRTRPLLCVFRLVQEGGLDPAVLSTLPPSLALDLMGRMRERQQAANRAQFEARAAAPNSFSQFQMQQYLAASQFRWVGEVESASGGGAHAVHAHSWARMHGRVGELPGNHALEAPSEPSRQCPS